ncbi:MAG: alpha/beta fold hydrolase [Bacteroidales bacterium]|nr:alpha/beta fold hydrolase [Bacteroidales bacterium]
MKLFYRRFGSGDPVIILHGVLGISDNWVTIGKRLAEKFEVFIPDQRNHGRSPHSPTFNYFALNDDLLEFIEDHELSNPILIGHSMGGKVAMNFVLDVALPVKKLVVIDISTRGYLSRQTHIEIIHAMQSVDFDKITKRSEVETELAPIKSSRLRQFILKNLYRVNDRRFGWRINLEAIFENLDLISEGIETDKTYDYPTLFIKGEASDYIQEDDSDLILNIFPQAVVKTIDGATHWLHADKPDDLCLLLSDFLQKDCAYK